MSVERLIAGRYLRSKQQMRFINIIMLVSVIGITVGVAALIVVLSVFNGFNSVVTNVLVGFDPHIRIEAASGGRIADADSLLGVVGAHGDVSAAAPFIAGKALLVAQRVNKVVMLRGVVDSTIDGVSGVKKRTILGSFAFTDNPERGSIVLGLTLADRLGTMVGSSVAILSPVGVDAMMVQLSEPIVAPCTVAGIYDSNNKDYDGHYAFVSLETARKLFQLDNEVSGIDVRLTSIERAERVKEALQATLGPSYRVSSWYDLHKDLYSVMQIERWTAYIILCMIVCVATFNVLGSLTMGVIEKRRDIGILKAIGATRRSILKIFMVEGILVGTIGTLLGSVLGLLVCYVQIRYQVFPLDPTVYIIPAIPVEVRWTDFVVVSGASMLLSILASLYPASRAARLTPVQAIRWE
ncbi:MAG TPA: ABC transporter permease [Bacteroidota bacterium]|nr:ABC transporter permease [Bacteroidota bacterium]